MTSPEFAAYATARVSRAADLPVPADVIVDHGAACRRIGWA